MKRSILDVMRGGMFRLHTALKKLFLFPVEIYRKYLSGWKPAPTCRFQPTCSAYAVDAVMEWGIVVGFLLAIVRVIRCNPFSKGGYDPVPSRKETVRRIKEAACRHLPRK